MRNCPGVTVTTTALRAGGLCCALSALRDYGMRGKSTRLRYERGKARWRERSLLNLTRHLKILASP